MSRRLGVKLPWYGKIRCLDNPEAAAIWRTRDEEPEPCEPFGFAHDQVVEENDDVQIGAALILCMDDLSPRERAVLSMLVLQDRTLEEVGFALDLSRERIRQIKCEAVRKLKRIAVDRHIYQAYIGR